MILLPWALVCLAALLGSIMVFAVARRDGRIHVPGAWLALALLPSAATSLLIAEPWFAVNPAWNVLRLALLFAWAPSLWWVEARHKTAYPTRTARWSFRTMLASGTLILNGFGWGRTQSWDLIQAHRDGGSAYCWLALEGEDGYIFARSPSGTLMGGKVMDSYGSEAYEYTVRWSTNSRVELRRADLAVLRFDPESANIERLAPIVR